MFTIPTVSEPRHCIIRFTGTDQTSLTTIYSTRRDVDSVYTRIVLPLLSYIQLKQATFNLPSNDANMDQILPSVLKTKANSLSKTLSEGETTVFENLQYRVLDHKPLSQRNGGTGIAFTWNACFGPSTETDEKVTRTLFLGSASKVDPDEDLFDSGPGFRESDAHQRRQEWEALFDSGV